MRAIAHRQRAVTIVSFALVAPLVLFIIFATMEMGRVLNTWLVITNEAREAARYAAVSFDSTRDWTQSANQSAEQTAVRAYITNRLTGVLDQAYLTPAPSVVVTRNASPNVQVTIYYKVPLVVPLVSDLLPNPFPITARSAMRGE
jgi:Flp pilus assembly protein TadG